MQFTDEQILHISTLIEPDELPGDLAAIADMVGVYPALMLASRLGGVVVYLRKWSDAPEDWSTEVKQWIDVIGENNTAVIIHLFGCGYADIPKCEALFIKYRNQTIKDLSKSKTSIELARMFNRSTRQIKRIRNESKDDRQTDLF